jgi:hypothetical protein
VKIGADPVELKKLMVADPVELTKLMVANPLTSTSHVT